MSFYRTLQPAQTPASLSNQNRFVILQERLFHHFMLVCSALGLPLGIYWTINRLSNGFEGTAALTGALLAGLLLLTLLRRLPYFLRAILFLVFLFLAGAWMVLNSGYGGPGFLILLMLPGFAGIFLGLKGAIVGLAFSLLAVWGIGLSSAAGIPIAAALPGSAPIHFAQVSGQATVFTVIALIFTFVLSLLISFSKTSVDQQGNIRAELDREKTSLEERVQQRTAEIERRLVQLRTAADISRSITSMLDPQQLLQQVVDLVLERNNYYYVGVFLLDERREYAVLMAGTGEAGQKMLAAGHRLQVGGSSMIGWCTANRQARIALDVGAEAVRFNNPNLPQTRSELALPIISRGLAIGALTVQSTAANAFDESDIVILQGIADSLAIAIENAQLFHQSQNDLEEIRALNQRFLQDAWGNVAASRGSLQFELDRTIPGSARTSQSEAISFPIVLREQNIGQITLEGGSAHLSNEDNEMIEMILNQTALALEGARLLEETQQRVSQEQKVNTLSAEFSRTTSIEEVLKAAIRELGQLPLVSEVTVHLSPALPVETSTDSAVQGKNGKGPGGLTHDIS